MLTLSVERERVNRERERERSMREESVDGGYLVTQGVYTGVEDFSKPVVRQLMVRSPNLLSLPVANDCNASSTLVFTEMRPYFAHHQNA